MNFKEQYFAIWQQAWNLHKQFADVTGTDQYWDRLVTESSRIAKQYESKPQYGFARDLILTVVAEVERVDRLNHRQRDEEKITFSHKLNI